MKGLTKTRCTTRAVLFTFFCLLFNFNLNAQNIGGIINTYTRVTAIDPCFAKITVTSSTGLAVGNGVILIQTNGAEMRDATNSTFGDVTDLRKVGLFEANVIDSIAGNDLYLRFQIANDYDLTGVVQLVSYPTYTNATVTSTLRAKAWDGVTGGVLAFQATNLTLNADIDATGTGFRGGRAPNPFTDCTGGPGSSAAGYVYSQFDQDGAPKGEGVAPTITGKENGRGAQGNGGGGGNNHNAGGGGGGNVATGGQGGQNREPGFFRCYGNNPGLGSWALQLLDGRAFMGGGGGAGHDNNGVASSGGNGGGVVIIKAGTISSSAARRIIAEGSAAAASLGDGGGGGGGGGTIVLEATTVGTQIRLSVNGGKGGDADNVQQVRCQGPGGGGGGGRLMINGVTLAGANMTINGGGAGLSVNSTAGNDCPVSSNGGQAGQVGILTQYSQTASIITQRTNDRMYRTHFVQTQPTNARVCVNRDTVITTLVRGLNVRYQWQRDNGSGFANLSNGGDFADVNTNRLRITGATAILNGNRFRCVTTGGCVTNTELTTQEITLTVTPLPTAAATPNTTAGSNTVSFTNTSTNATAYRWSFGANNGTSTATNPTFLYPAQGSYMVTLTAYNYCDSVTTTIPVSLNSRPVAGFSANTNDYCVPATVRFQNGASQNTSSWRWIFTGGTPAISTDSSPVVTYNAAGNYDVTLIVTNPNGNDTLSRASYVRVNGVPAPSFTWLRNGMTISFNNPTTGVTNFNWNFGNGQTSTATNPQITYAQPGTYVVSLTATNSCGTTTVRDTLVLLGLPSTTVTASIRDGCSPLRVQYSGQNPSNVSNWRWTFNGGSPATSTVQNPLITYNAAGTYSATLVISNAAGNTTLEFPNYITVRETPRADFTAVAMGTAVQIQNNSTGGVTNTWNYGNNTANEVRNERNFTYIYPRNGLYTITLTVINPFCGAATSRVVGINYNDTEDVSLREKITVFPNPTNGILNFEIKDLTIKDGKIKVYSTLGEMLATFPLAQTSQQTLDISELPSGVYWLSVEAENGKFMQKIMKY